MHGNSIRVSNACRGSSTNFVDNIFSFHPAHVDDEINSDWRHKIILVSKHKLRTAWVAIWWAITNIMRNDFEMCYFAEIAHVNELEKTALWMSCHLSFCIVISHLQRKKKKRKIENLMIRTKCHRKWDVLTLKCVWTFCLIRVYTFSSALTFSACF